MKVGDLDVFKGKGEAGIEDFLKSGMVGKLKDGVKLLSDGDIDFRHQGQGA